jgi:predicted Zn finger-like uncharacterized protein
MILTCPSCGTQYVVKDGAIPPTGRQVRCKACQHSWREVPASTREEPVPLVAELDEAAVPSPMPPDPPAAEAVDEPREHYGQSYAASQELMQKPPESVEAPAPVGEEPPADARPAQSVAAEAEPPGHADEAHGGRLEWVEDDEFSPFARREPAQAKSRGRIVTLLLVLLVIAAIVAGIWFLAPPEWKQRLGIAAAADTPLQLMMTHSDRTQLASGNEFLNISGRIINPTTKQQKVPPIHAQLHEAKGKVVYSWTIPPPARSIPPGGSTTFNSAELNIPPAAEELTITLGEPKA